MAGEEEEDRAAASASVVVAGDTATASQRKRKADDEPIESVERSEGNQQRRQKKQITISERQARSEQSPAEHAQLQVDYRELYEQQKAKSEQQIEQLKAENEQQKAKSEQQIEQLKEQLRKAREAEQLRNQQHSRDTGQGFAGENVSTNGRGSRTTDADLNKTIAKRDMTKGAALTHVFFRTFLRSLKEGATFCKEEESFVRSLEAKWKVTSNEIAANRRSGVTRRLNSSGQVEIVGEPVATSILSALTQSFITQVYSTTPGNWDGMPLWLSEVEMKTTISSHDGSKTEEKKPRADGILCGFDRSGEGREIVGMRGFLCNENRIGQVHIDGIHEGLGNTIDVIAQKPKNKPMWPTICMFTSFYNDSKISFTMDAFIPDKTNDKMVSTVSIWKGDSIESYFQSIYALCKAWNEFASFEKLPEFGSFYRNVAYCQVEQKYYKAFWSSDCKPNLDLVLKFMDESAVLVKDGKDNPLFLEMKKKGSALDISRRYDQSVRASAFVDISKQVKEIHEMHFVHGDIRLANLLFLEGKGEEGKGERFVGCVCDFDMSGEPGSAYPSNFNVEIGDGKRHEDAEPDEPMQPIHDWVALASVMQLFTASDGYQSSWDEAISDVEKGDVPSRSNLNFTIVLKKDECVSTGALEPERTPGAIPTATGSPEMT